MFNSFISIFLSFFSFSFFFSFLDMFNCFISIFFIFHQLLNQNHENLLSNLLFRILNLPFIHLDQHLHYL
jgi:hypothetical protein